MAIFVRFLVFGIIAFVAYRFLFPAPPIVVELTGDGVGRCKGLSDFQKKRIAKFAEEELLEGETILVKGFRESNDQIRWVFPKATSRGLAQRFRNVAATN